MFTYAVSRFPYAFNLLYKTHISWLAVVIVEDDFYILQMLQFQQPVLTDAGVDS